MPRYLVLVLVEDVDVLWQKYQLLERGAAHLVRTDVDDRLGLGVTFCGERSHRTRLGAGTSGQDGGKHGQKSVAKL